MKKDTIYRQYYMHWCPCLSLHMSCVAHQAGAYPGLCSMKRLGIFLLPPGWDASPSLGYFPKN